jgi:hypothetical protein
MLSMDPAAARFFSVMCADSLNKYGLDWVYSIDRWGSFILWEPLPSQDAHAP